MFHAKVKGRVFQILGIDYITSGSVGLQIDFEFDDEWTGLERYATFEAGSVSISVELENDACVIPWEVLEDPNVNLRIGIRGSNGDNVVIPTIWREYEIHEGTKFSEDSGSPASTTIIEQLSARMDALEENGGVDIFWATYDLSSYDEIYEQFNTHNRLVACVYNNRVYFMQKEINNSTAYKFFAPDFTSTQSRMYWLIIDNDDQWTNGYEEITSGGGDTSEIAWVTYGTTTYSEVKAAYDAGKQVLCEYGTITYQLTFWMGLNGPFFTFTAPVYDSRVTTQSIYWLKVDSSGWSNGSIDIPAGGSSPSAYTSNPAALGNSASPGSSDKYARGDHVHPKPSALDLGITVPDAATAMPAMDGTAAVGSSSKYAKEDHVHPSDTNKADAWGYEEIDDDGAVTQALDAGKIYFFSGTLTALTITLSQATAPAQYHFIFDGEPTLTMPNTVVMPDDFQVDASKHYEIDILTVDGVNYFGTAQSW